MKNYLVLLLISLVSFSCVEVEPEQFNENDLKMISNYIELYEEDYSGDISLEIYMKLFENQVKGGKYSYTNEQAFQYYIDRHIELYSNPEYYPVETVYEYFLTPRHSIEFNPLERLHNIFMYELTKSNNVTVKTLYLNKIGEIKYPFIPFIQTQELYIYFKTIKQP